MQTKVLIYSEINQQYFLKVNTEVICFALSKAKAVALYKQE